MEYSASQHQNCFPFFSDEQATVFFGYLEERRVVAGEQLLLSSGDSATLFFVVSGEFDIYGAGKGRATSHLLARIGNGSFMGEGALVGNTPICTTISCARDSLLLGLSTESFERYLLEQPVAALLLLKDIVAVTHLRLSHCSARISHIL